MAGSIEDFAAQFGVRPKKKPQGLRAEVVTPAEVAARKKKVADKRSLRQKMRDRRKVLDNL
jgi:hypothetical protein